MTLLAWALSRCLVALGCMLCNSPFWHRLIVLTINDHLLVSSFSCAIIVAGCTAVCAFHNTAAKSPPVCVGGLSPCGSDRSTVCHFCALTPHSTSLKCHFGEASLHTGVGKTCHKVGSLNKWMYQDVPFWIAFDNMNIKPIWTCGWLHTWHLP